MEEKKRYIKFKDEEEKICCYDCKINIYYTKLDSLTEYIDNGERFCSVKYVECPICKKKIQVSSCEYFSDLYLLWLVETGNINIINVDKEYTRKKIKKYVENKYSKIK